MINNLFTLEHFEVRFKLNGGKTSYDPTFKKIKKVGPIIIMVLS